ncbi:MAG: ABC transporter ATP-binding protein, partial [Acetobacteraceae bacterium]
MALSDRVAVMENGIIVECDTPESLYLRPRTAFAARFVGQADLLPATPAAKEDGRWWLDTPLGRIESRCPPASPVAPLHLLIRPEHIEFAEADGPNV